MAQHGKTLLVLGAGRVAFPCVEYAVRRNYKVTVVSDVADDLKKMSSLLPEVKTTVLDISCDPERLSELVSRHDAVVSLVLPHMHAVVAEHCIHHKKAMVSSSYIDDHLRKLDQRARDAGIALIAECGLDPGIDHMIAKDQIDTIKENGGMIKSLSTICGGLPAPQFAIEPLKYKFSWNPKGVFLSCLKPAKFLKDGKVIDVTNILDHTWTTTDLMDGQIEFENIPNRDSVEYKDLYNIPSVTDLYRGTIRYKGYSNVMKSVIHLGLTSSENFPPLSASAPDITWRNIISHLLKLPKESSLEDITNEWAKICQKDMVSMETILRLFTENELAPKAPCLLDSLSAYLAKKIPLAPHETDLVIMRCETECVWPNGSEQRLKTDILEEGQVQGASAMSRTVGLTVAAVASLLLEGEIQETGVIIPVFKEIYKPVLDQLRREGIQIKTSTIDM